MDNICKFSCLCFLYVVTGNLQTRTLHKGNHYIDRFKQIRPIDYRTFSINRSINFHQLPTIKTVLIYKTKTPVFLSAASLPLMFFNKKISTPKKTIYPHGPAFFYGVNTRNILEYMNHPPQPSIPKVSSTKLITKFTPSDDHVRSPKAMDDFKMLQNDDLNMKLIICKETDNAIRTLESREMCTKSPTYSNVQDKRAVINYGSNQHALPIISTIIGQNVTGPKWSEKKQNKTNFSFPYSGQSFFTLDDVVIPSTTETKQKLHYANNALLPAEYLKNHKSTLPTNLFVSNTKVPLENNIITPSKTINFNVIVQTTQRNIDSFLTEMSKTTTLPNFTTTPLTIAAVINKATTTTDYNNSTPMVLDKGIDIVPQTSAKVLINNENLENNRIKQKLKPPNGILSSNFNKFSALHSKKPLVNTNVDKIHIFKNEHFIRTKLFPTKPTSNIFTNITTTSSEKTTTVGKSRIIQSKYRQFRPTSAKKKFLTRSTDTSTVNITLTSNKSNVTQKPPKRLIKRTETKHVSTDDRKENRTKRFETQKVVTTTTQISRTNNKKISLESAIMTIASHFENSPRNISSTTKNKPKLSSKLLDRSASSLTDIPQLPIEIFFRKRDQGRNNIKPIK